MAENPRQEARSFGKADTDKIMQMDGVCGVLEGTYPLHIITGKKLPTQTKKAIIDEYGAGNVEFHADGPINAQAQGAERPAPSQAERPAAAPASAPAKVRVSHLRQFEGEAGEE